MLDGVNSHYDPIICFNPTKSIYFLLFCLEGPKQLQTGNSKENRKQHGRPGYIIGAVIVAVSMVTILVGVSIYYNRKRKNSAQNKIV
jgi:hypothetical protein